ncbi:MAG: MFS transporter [Sedimentisphaerales bacterium]
MKVSLVNKPRRIWPIYGAAFAMSISINSWWTSMPFIVRDIGGTKAHVGYAWAANMTGYLVCLLLAALFLGSHNPRNTTRISSVVVFISTVVIGVFIYIILSQNITGNILLIWLIIISGAIAGGATSLFWPFLMSWVSEDLEGAVLNRRLGRYNGSWSFSLIIGPVIGGMLVEASTFLPVIFTTVAILACFMFLNLTTNGSVNTTLFDDDNHRNGNASLDMASIKRFRWMARVVLFSSWACIAIARSQFALLFTGMGNSETMFGVLIAIFGICNFTSMIIAGRYPYWHFKPFLLFLAQSALAVSLVLIIYGSSIPVFILSFVILGCGFGFAYSSHLFYGACGTKKRSVQMAIHEATISSGIIIGSATGGYLAGKFGLYQPYWFALILVAAGFIAQGILRYSKPDLARVPQLR